MSNVPTLLARESDAIARQKEASFVDVYLPKKVFSFSQYNAYKICGEAYRRKYLDKVPWNGNNFTLRGSSVHKGVEIALKRKIERKLNPELAPISLEEGIANVGADYDQRSLGVEDWGDDKPKELRAKVIQLYTLYHQTVLPTINPVGVETFFAEKVGGVPMTGYIDLLTEDPAVSLGPVSKSDDAPTKFVVHDLKTAKAKWSEDDVEKNPQLTLYAMVTGTPHISVDQLLLTKESRFVAMTATRTAQHAAVFTEDLVEVVESIKRGDFPKTSIDNWSCGPRCQYWKDCRGKKR